jgi:hypothetical protein
MAPPAIAVAWAVCDRMSVAWSIVSFPTTPAARGRSGRISTVVSLLTLRDLGPRFPILAVLI